MRKKIYRLQRLGRIQPEQITTNLPPNTIPEFELIREKRKGGMRMKDIMREFFPGGPEMGKRGKYRNYNHVKKMKMRTKQEKNRRLKKREEITLELV